MRSALLLQLDIGKLVCNYLVFIFSSSKSVANVLFMLYFFQPFIFLNVSNLYNCLHNKLYSLWTATTENESKQLYRCLSFVMFGLLSLSTTFCWEGSTLYLMRRVYTVFVEKVVHWMYLLWGVYTVQCVQYIFESS